MLGKKNYAKCLDLFDREEIIQEYPDRDKKLFRDSKYILSKWCKDGFIHFQVLQVLEIGIRPTDADKVYKYEDPSLELSEINGWEFLENQVINEDTLNYDLKETKNHINRLFGELEYCKSKCLIHPYTPDFLSFYSGHIAGNAAFGPKDNNNNEKYKRKMYEVYLDFVYVISLNELLSIAKHYIDENKVVPYIDKKALLSELEQRADKKAKVIIPNRKADLIMSDYIHIHCDDEKKEIIFARLSPMQLRVPFSFFWTQVKNMLSMAFIPAILLYITTADNKKPIYFPLAIVYFITLILADEKQVDRIRDGMKKSGHSVDYATLFYIGMYPVIYLILFALELAFYDKLQIYRINLPVLLIMDVPLCYTTYLLISLILILVSWMTVHLTKHQKVVGVIRKSALWAVRVLFYAGIALMIYYFIVPSLSNNNSGDFMTYLSLCVAAVGLLSLTSDFLFWKKRRDQSAKDTDDKGSKAA